MDDGEQLIYEWAIGMVVLMAIGAITLLIYGAIKYYPNYPMEVYVGLGSTLIMVLALFVGKMTSKAYVKILLWKEQ